VCAAADKYDDAYKPWATGPARKLAKAFPEHHTVYDWYFSTAGGKWQPWMDSVKGQKLPTDAQYSSIIVSTVDVVRYTYLIQLLVANHLPLLLVSRWS
jgi:dynein heavy chain, axonemal